MNLAAAIPYVTGGLSLVAFVIAAIFYAYRASLKQRRDIILSAPPADRIEAIDSTADFLRIDTAALNQKAKERIILEQIKVRSERNYMIFFASLFFGLILAVIALVTILRPEPSPAPAPAPVATVPGSPSAPEPLVKVFTHPDLSREGRIMQIKVTVVSNGRGGGSFNVDFFWTGSPGTWSGSQSTTITILGQSGEVLQGITIPIDRSGCFYGGGNHQTKGGELTFDPKIAASIGVTLSEVHNRTEGGC
ncbi:hypothetical protein [Rhizobium sp. RAF56]|uniref:hypothetical protein n=1 Tax=Rhizobium sp. RAF56 TaxID=3233062 RepID=UPI003F9C574B